jgi:hypothetical protein
MTLKTATEHIQENGNLLNGLYKQFTMQFTYSFSESNPQSSVANMILRKRNVLNW